MMRTLGMTRPATARELEAAGEDQRDGADTPYRDADREADQGADDYERWLDRIGGDR